MVQPDAERGAPATGEGVVVVARPRGRRRAWRIRRASGPTGAPSGFARVPNSPGRISGRPGRLPHFGPDSKGPGFSGQWTTGRSSPASPAGRSGRSERPSRAGRPGGPAGGTALQPSAVAIGQVAGGAIAVRPLGGDALVQPVARKSSSRRRVGDRALVLQREQDHGGQVLVDLRLQLQLELRHRPTRSAARNSRNRKWLTSSVTVQRRPGCRAAEPDARVVPHQPLHHGRLQHDARARGRPRPRVTSIAAAGARIARRVVRVEQELRDRRLRVEAVEASPADAARPAAGPGPVGRHCSRPSPARSATMPRSASRARPRRRLFVCTQRS